MKHFSRLRPSPAMIVALIALTLSLGGTSYAAIVLPANSVGAAQLKRNAVITTKIKAAAVTSTKIRAAAITQGKIAADAVTGAAVRDDSLSGADILESSLAAVPDADKVDGRHAADFLPVSALATLNADKLDGKHAADFVPVTALATLNADRLDGKHATDFVQGEGRVLVGAAVLAELGSPHAFDFVVPGQGTIHITSTFYTDPYEFAGFRTDFRNEADHDMRVWTGWPAHPAIWFAPGLSHQILPYLESGTGQAQLILVGGSGVSTVNFAWTRLGASEGKVWWHFAAHAVIGVL